MLLLVASKILLRVQDQGFLAGRRYCLLPDGGHLDCLLDDLLHTVRDEHLLFCDPAFYELDDLGRILVGWHALHIEVLEGEVDRLNLNLVKFLHDLFPHHQAAGHDCVQRSGLLHQLLHHRSQEQAVRHHQWIEVDFERQGLRVEPDEVGPSAVVGPLRRGHVRAGTATPGHAAGHVVQAHLARAAASVH